MEVAGLTIGAVALVGTFKDCIDLYSMISAARSLGEDAALLETKLDVEKMLFFQWADRVGLVKPQEWDKRLDDEALNATVAGVLLSIKTLLGEGKALQNRYGLERRDLGIGETEFIDDTVKASTPRMERFLRNFEKLSLSKSTPEGRTETKSFKVKDRWCWVVRDKDKFEQLIQELFYFNSQLDKLVPDNNNTRSTLTFTEEDLADIRSIPYLKLILKAAPGMPYVLEAVKRVIRTANQNRILQRLWFRRIEDRRETVSGAHTGTFSWALSPPNQALRWDNLCDWLREENSGLYWLAGKAGSGKSTLMKYLHGHSRTRELLKEWAAASDLTFIDFFFYQLGMPEQKSQEGLFRGLLYQVLSQHRDLVEDVMPNMWKEALATEDDPEENISMPSAREMQAGLLDFAKSQSGKLFLFIDGLDEYDGRPMDAAAFIEELGKLDSVKILVSSRPLPEFVAAFQGKPKMNLQDLTRRDIETYVDDTITHHPYMTNLALEDPKGSSELIRDFNLKSSGVFLWVVLACRSVLEGFAAFDTLSDLKVRVHEIPPELEDLFRHMLHRIDPRYRSQSVRLLRLMFDSQTKESVGSIPTLGLALSERRGFRSGWGEPSTPTLSIDQKRMKCQMMEGRLRSRCYGLVEIQRFTSTNEPNMVCVCGSTEHDPIVDSGVAFMHRSVYEFLSTSNIWDSEWMQIDDEAFHSHAVLSMLWIEIAGMGQRRSIHKNICINNALLHIYYSEMDGESPSTVAANLSRLQAIFQGDCHGLFWDEARQVALHRARCRHFNHDLSIGVALAAEMGMTKLLKFAIEQPNDLAHCLCPTEDTRLEDCTGASTPDGGEGMKMSGCQSAFRVDQDKPGLPLSQMTGLPLLYHATYRPLLRHLHTMKLSFQDGRSGIRGLETVRYLLRAGCDPNEKFHQPNGNQVTSPWHCWLHYIGNGQRQRSWSDPEASCEGAQITLELLAADASLDVPCTKPSCQPQNGAPSIPKQVSNRGPSQLQAWARSDGLWTEVRDKICQRLVPEGGSSTAADSFDSPSSFKSINSGKVGTMVVEERNMSITERGSDEKRLLACPFYKFDPLRHEICGERRLTSTAYVLQHVRRQHLYKEGRCDTESFIYTAEYELLKSLDPSKTEVERWYAMWDIIYHSPRPSSPFRDEILEQMLKVALHAHRSYRENIGEGSLAQLLASQSTNSDLTLQDMEKAIEELLFDGKRVRDILRLIPSTNSRRQVLSTEGFEQAETILRRQGSWAALNRSDKVTAIIQRALGKLAGSEATEVAAHVASASDSDGVVELDDEEPVSKKEFNFATLLLAEVWKDVMPVAKPNYAPITTAPSLGMQAQLGLSGFIPAAPSDDENWVSSKIQVTQSYEDMKKELEKQRAEVDKLRAECDAKIADAMSKTQQAEASRDSLNQTLTSQLKTKERQAAEAENRKVVIEQELNNVRGQLQTRTAERDDNARDRDNVKMKLESTTNDLNIAKGQLIPNERDDLHIFHIQWGQTLPVMLGSVINKCYTYHSQKRAIPVTVEFFNNEDSLRGTSKLAVFVYRRNKSGSIKVKGAMEGSTVVFD